MVFTREIQEFVDRNTWTFAKSMPTWPHEYLVRDKVDDRDLFMEMVYFIHNAGTPGGWYNGPKAHLYYRQDNRVYWVMGYPVAKTWPIEDEDIINRCLEHECFDYRKARNTLPHQLKTMFGDDGSFKK